MPCGFLAFYADGDGPYLRADSSGAKRWILRTMVKGERCDIWVCRSRSTAQRASAAMCLSSFAGCGYSLGPGAVRRRVAWPVKKGSHSRAIRELAGASLTG
jgi:hypothetical protein